MEDNNNQNEVNATDEMEKNYSDLLSEYNKNHVKREEYDKVIEANRKLMQDKIDGKFDKQSEQESIRSANDIRKDLFSGKELSNLKYAELSLELRDAVKRETGEDIFVAKNSLYTPGSDSYDSAERVAEVFKDCIDYANGDSQAFTNELMRRTNDVKLPR